jgi:hypothetical protein
VREVIGLEVGDPVTRLDAHNRTAIDADDIARAEQSDRAIHRGGLRTAIYAIASHFELNVDLGADLHVGGEIGSADLIREALPKPRKE